MKALASALFVAGMLVAGLSVSAPALAKSGAGFKVEIEGVTKGGSARAPLGIGTGGTSPSGI